MVDKKDVLILSHLRKNSNQPITNIAKNTGIPLTTIYDRMKLHEKGIIRKYTVLLDFAKLGYAVKVKIALSVKKDEREKLLRFLLGHANLNSLSKINMGYDFFAEMIFRNQNDAHNFMEELEDIFRLEKKHVFFVIDEIESERFFANGGK